MPIFINSPDKQVRQRKGITATINYRGLNNMKKISLLCSFSMLLLGSVLAQAQEGEQIPAGAVVRQVNCQIIGDRLNFADILERARQLEFNDNAPNNVFFRRPVYASPEYHANWDFMIAQYYPSFSEMTERRIAEGDNAYGRLGISCGTASVVRNIPVNEGGGLEDFSLMTTQFCNLNAGATGRAAYARAREGMANIARDSGNTTAMQMWFPGLGGEMNPPFDFVSAHVGTNAAELMERLDLSRDGYRGLALSGRADTHTCSRPSLWSTNRVYQASN
jgi:hypothetical protein